MMHLRPTGIFNIGSGVGTTIADFVRSHSPRGLEIVDASSGPPTSLVADVSKLRSLLAQPHHA